MAQARVNTLENSQFAGRGVRYVASLPRRWGRRSSITMVTTLLLFAGGQRNLSASGQPQGPDSQTQSKQAPEQAEAQAPPQSQSQGQDQAAAQPTYA